VVFPFETKVNYFKPLINIFLPLIKNCRHRSYNAFALGQKMFALVCRYNPMRKKIMAAATQGFHMFHAHTKSL
jgi:hypothetical protein